MINGTVKIRFELIHPYVAKKRKKPIRKGYCQICGAKLTNEKSIDLGVGINCRRKYAKIILEIPGEAQS
jgi:hypothetical protein